jgi:hypothetical protein
MNGIGSSHQAEGGKKPIEPEDMVAMEMADEDMVYFGESDPVFSELHLGAFTTVYQK